MKWGLGLIMSIIALLPLKADKVTQQVNLGAQATGRIAQLWAHHLRDRGDLKKAEAANLIHGLSFIVQAYTIYRLAHEADMRQRMAPAQSMSGTNLLPLKMLKASLEAFYFAYGGAYSTKINFKSQQRWNLGLAGLSFFTKCLDRLLYRRTGVPTKYSLTDEFQLQTDAGSDLGKLLEFVSALLDYTEVAGYLTRYEEFRVLSTADLIKIFPRKIFLEGQCGECNEDGSNEEPLYLYCPDSDKVCLYHEKCYKKQLQIGKHLCKICEQPLKWEPVWDSTSRALRLIKVLLFPIYMML